MTDLKVLEEYIRPDWLTDEWLQQNSYHGLKFMKIFDGSWATTGAQLFSWRVFLGIDETGYMASIDYPDRASAQTALKIWDGIGSPPGPWLKYKGRRFDGQVVDIEGPGLTGERISE